MRVLEKTHTYGTVYSTTFKAIASHGVKRSISIYFALSCLESS
jgi:hypothetical protein